jgi:AraC-like DNA-binding protein
MFPWNLQKVHFLSCSCIFVTVRPGSLEVLAYLPPPLLSHLRVVLAGSEDYSLTASDRWDGFVDALDHGTADIVVVDPCADGVGRAAPLAALLESRLTLPVVVYTSVSPASFQTIAELARHSGHQAAHHVVLHRYDDEPRRFLELLQRQPATSLTTALLGELAPALTTLPPVLLRAVERLVRRPTEFRDVADLARAARATVRTTYRYLDAAGVRSPRALIVAAKLLQAYAYARDPHQSLGAIAKKVGYSAPRILTKHMREAVGATPRAVRRLVRPADFISSLSRWVIPARGATMSAPATAMTLDNTATRTAASHEVPAPISLMVEPDPARPSHESPPTAGLRMPPPADLAYPSTSVIDTPGSRLNAPPGDGGGPSGPWAPWGWTSRRPSF